MADAPTQHRDEMVTSSGAADRRPDGVTESLLVRVHPGLCEGWGNCHRWAPDVYPLDDEGLIDVHLVEVPPHHAVEAWMGAQACPAGVITVRVREDATSVEQDPANRSNPMDPGATT